MNQVLSVKEAITRTLKIGILKDALVIDLLQVIDIPGVECGEVEAGVEADEELKTSKCAGVTAIMIP